MKIETRSLSKGVPISIRLASTESATIRAISGDLWITMEGDSADYILHANETYTSTQQGLLVIESLTAAAKFELTVSRHDPYMDSDEHSQSLHRAKGTLARV